jgi:hypothetical protein
MARVLIKVAALAGIALVLSFGTTSAEIGCRAIGIEARQGETLCIRTPDGLRRAECGMNLNVSSWTFLGEACSEPSSRETKEPEQAPSDAEEN